MSAEELRNYKGILVRDYNQKIRDTRQQKELLVQFLNRIVRMESFQDDFYRKPLEQLLELSDNGTQVLTQLKTTVQSYDSLMEKLEVDISVVEKEKARIVESGWKTISGKSIAILERLTIIRLLLSETETSKC